MDQLLWFSLICGLYTYPWCTEKLSTCAFTLHWQGGTFGSEWPRDQAQPYKENQIFNSSFQDKSSSHALGANTETAKKETTGICEGTRVSELLQQKPPLARQISSTIHGLPRSDPQLQSGARSISHTEQWYILFCLVPASQIPTVIKYSYSRKSTPTFCF